MNEIICGNCSQFQPRDGIENEGACYGFDVVTRRKADQMPRGAKCFDPAEFEFELEPSPVGDAPKPPSLADQVIELTLQRDELLAIALRVMDILADDRVFEVHRGHPLIIAAFDEVESAIQAAVGKAAGL